ncbi:hypothetical protein [Micromonospora sp. NBRC 101691]|uniref:hypothetical protein n=1 Tax=Micromonospora sp. NBRC 101691 TaxID=3032198 RepID=UPI0024A1DDB6|nr:hypothetical protein [Micromonospora sp. NBRC 101691]GLY21661.1 hypothetical protein Misp04_13930 [Micromonospora sp. NBRC 101691]
MTAVALAVLAVIAVVLAAAWRSAERDARADRTRADTVAADLTRTEEERDGLAVKAHHLAGRNQALRAELARLTAAAHLTPDTDPDPLEALYALPAYDPEGNR